jgi:hypothetical protein
MNIKLPPMIKSMLASAPVRAYHHLWHLVRNEDDWNSLTIEQKNELGPDWVAPRFEQESGGGLDFLYMHRVMIKMVNDHLSQMPDPNYSKVEGWNPIPFDHNDETWPMPLLWGGAHRAFAWAKNPLTSKDFKRRVLEEFRNEEWLKQQTLDVLGSELESTIHGWMHLHWSEKTPENPWEDSVENDWLGAPYSSHVNDAFWKLHGFIDETIDLWEQATGETADFSDSWAGASGYLPEMRHTADPELLMKLNVQARPLKIMTWKVPIIEGVNEEDIVIHSIED